MDNFVLITTSKCRRKIFESILLDEVDGEQFLSSYPIGKVKLDSHQHVQTPQEALDIIKWQVAPVILCVPDRETYHTDSSNVLTVTTEEMCLDPMGIAREVCKFLGTRASSSRVKNGIAIVQDKIDAVLT